MDSILRPFIEEKGFVILDGAMATELEARGANLNHGLWSAKLLKENPALIQQVHEDYLKNGSDVITTASYQASFEGFAKYGYSKEAAIHFMQLSVQLAIDARDQFVLNHPAKLSPLVAASVGPYGASLADGSEYRGNYGKGIQELKDFHRERMEVLVGTKMDVLACETIPCIDEAIALKELLTEFPNVQAWISFSAKSGTEICSGELFEDAIKAIEDSPQIIALGINCTAPEYIKSLVEIGKKHSRKPIIIYPNKGENYDPTKKIWLSDHKHLKSYFSLCQDWFAAGAEIIGGCCRTTPEDIRGLKGLKKE